MHRLVVIAIVMAAFAPAAAEQQELILPVAVNGYTQQPIQFQVVITIFRLQMRQARQCCQTCQENRPAMEILKGEF